MKPEDKRKVYTLLGVAVAFGGKPRGRPTSRSYLVTFPDGLSRSRKKRRAPPKNRRDPPSTSSRKIPMIPRPMMTAAHRRTTRLERNGRNEWTVRRLDEGAGSTAVYTTLREARESLTSAGCTVVVVK